MPERKSFIDGDALVDFILDVRTTFLAPDANLRDADDRPSSVHLIAIEAFEARSTDGQLAIVRDLLDANPGLIVERHGPDMFRHADTPAAYLTDLVCEVTYQVLARDPSIDEEHHRRLAFVQD